MSLLPRHSGGIPTEAFLQLADRCNYSCAHCYQVHGERGEMSTDEVKLLLDSLAKAGTLFVLFTGGEVTLRPDFLELVSYARRLRFAVLVATNGYLVDEEVARRLAEEAVCEVRISVYSADPEVHDSITRVPGSFERTIEAIRALRRHGVTVVLKTPLMTVNADAYGDVVGLAQAEGCFHSFDPSIIVREDGDRGPLALRATQAAVRRVASDPALHFLDAPLREKSLDEPPCTACDTATISADGTIRPCSPLPFSLGNVRDGVTTEAFQGSAAARFVLGLRWRDLPACRVCDLVDYCSRCHANALLEDGDIFGPSTVACLRAVAHFRLRVGPRAGSRDPETGPFEIVERSRLVQRAWDRGDAQIPSDVRSALVAGDDTDRGSGKPRIHLRVLEGAARPAFRT